MGFQDDTRHNRIQRETNNDARHNRMQTEEQWHNETQHNAERREMTQDTTEYRGTMTQGDTTECREKDNDTRHNRMQTGTMIQGDTTECREDNDTRHNSMQTEGQWHKETQQNTEKDNDGRRRNKIQRRVMTQGDTTKCRGMIHKRLTWPQLWSALAEVPKSVWHHPVKSSGTAAPPCWPEHSPTHNTNIQLVPSTNVWSVHKPHKLVSSVNNPCAINVWSIHNHKNSCHQCATHV